VMGLSYNLYYVNPSNKYAYSEGGFAPFETKKYGSEPIIFALCFSPIRETTSSLKGGDGVSAARTCGSP